MMFLRYTFSAFLPHLLLWLATAGAWTRYGIEALWAVAGIPVALLWTIIAVTGGRPYRKPRAATAPPALPPPPASSGGREARKSQSSEDGAAWLLSLFLALGVALLVELIKAIIKGVHALVEAAQGWDWQTVSLIVAIPDLLLTIFVLRMVNGFESFVRVDAGREVLRFYRRNRRFLCDEISLSVVTSELRSLGTDATPAQAWDAARSVLQHLEEIARRGRVRCEKIARSARRLKQEERALKARLQTLQRSPVASGVLDDEIEALRNRLRQIGEGRELESTFSPEDL